MDTEEKEIDKATINYKAFTAMWEFTGINIQYTTILFFVGFNSPFNTRYQLSNCLSLENLSGLLSLLFPSPLRRLGIRIRYI